KQRPTREQIPERCLVRVVDVRVEPGRTYEYRLKVRMANPNYKGEDVAVPVDAVRPELESGWSRPGRVQSPPDLVFSAVDERALDASGRYRGPYWRDHFSRDKYVFLQAHRWLDKALLRKGCSVEILSGRAYNGA